MSHFVSLFSDSSLTQSLFFSDLEPRNTSCPKTMAKIKGGLRWPAIADAEAKCDSPSSSLDALAAGRPAAPAAPISSSPPITAAAAPKICSSCLGRRRRRRGSERGGKHGEQGHDLPSTAS